MPKETSKGSRNQSCSGPRVSAIASCHANTIYKTEVENQLMTSVTYSYGT